MRSPAVRLPLRFATSLLALGWVLASGPAAAEGERPWWAGELSASAGAEWSAGDYDEPGDDTEILFLPFSVTYRLDDLALTPAPLDQIAFRVTVPYLQIDTPLAFFAETPTDRAQSLLRNERERGLGDVVASATYTWFSLDDRWPALELTGKVKIPTADEDRNLGTGATDWFAQIDTFKTWGRFTGFATLGARFPGDPPSGELRDSLYASGGVSTRVIDAVSVGAYYSWFEAASAPRSDSHELVGFASWRVHDALRIEPYGAWGVAGYVPDYAVGLTLRVTTAIGRR